MARSTFDGPILAGDKRFGSQRDVGYTDLIQSALLDFAVTTPGIANYGGASGTFVTSGNIPNQVATIWTPQAGAYSTSGPTQISSSTITADTSGTIYRGVSFLIPQGSNITDVIVDVGTLPIGGGVTANSIQPYVSNTFATATGVYGTMSAITSATRGTATFVGTQLTRSGATLQDVQNIQPGQQPTWFSQVVFTIQMLGSTMNAPTSGKLGITLSYVQSDPNIGNSSTYPYGNFD